MLTFEEKKAVFASYKELEEVPVSMSRLNYHFAQSAVAKTMVVKFLHPKSANAFVYAGYLPKEETKDGYISVRDADEKTIRMLVEKAIDYLKKTEDGYVEGYQEVWEDDHADSLTLMYENPMWTVLMSSGSVEAVFKTKEAAESYLEDEGFWLH